VKALDSLTIEDHANYNVVCYTENLTGFKNIIEANTFCHEKGVGFVLCETLGLFGYAFVDYGPKHAVNDSDGENCQQFMVVSITNEEHAVVTVHEDKRHSYQEGDHVKFNEIEGMVGINNQKPVEVTRILGPFSFKIDLDTREMPAYTRQGLIENVKVTKYEEYHPLAQSYLNPVASQKSMMIECPDARYLFTGRGENLHVALRAMHDFHTQHGHYPTIEDGDAVVAMAKEINAAAKEKEQCHNEELDVDMVRKAVIFANSSIVPQAAFFGGIIAQEIVKKTGKYSPLKQWLHYDILETLNMEDQVNRQPMNCRYDD
jgi:ubiquitin-activating enzyme E1